MTKNIYCGISHDEAKSIYLISYSKSSPLFMRRKEDRDGEQAQLFLFLNTWYDIAKESSFVDEIAFKAILVNTSLFSVIELFEKLSDALVGFESRTAVMQRARECYNGPSLQIQWIYNILQLVDLSRCDDIQNEQIRKLFTFCRFGKRYTPMNTNAYLQDSIQSFIDTQSRVRPYGISDSWMSYRLTKDHQFAQYATSGYPWYILEALRKEVSNFFRFYDCDKDGKVLSTSHHVPISLHGDIQHCDIPTGAYSSQCNQPTIHKIGCIEDYLQDIGLPFRNTFSRGEIYRKKEFVSKTGKHVIFSIGEPIRFVRVNAVPKNYKKARLIGEERVYLQFLQSEVDKYLDYVLESDLSVGNQTKRVSLNRHHGTRMRYFTSKAINMHDQEVNRELCRIASVTGDLSTVDLTSASDSNTAALVRAVFPPDFVKACDSVRANYYTTLKTKGRDIPTDLKLLYTFGTMGSKLTMKTQTILYTSIARVATKIAISFGDAVSQNYWMAWAYGDDSIISRQATPYFFTLLEALGFIVNDAKSCFSGLGESPAHCYRESCGVEYFGGADLKPVYWPRKAIKEKEYESIISLIDLQHSLFSLGFTTNFLSTELYRICPTLTETSPGVDSPAEIWTSFPNEQVTKSVEGCPTIRNLDGKDIVVTKGEPIITRRILHNSCATKIPKFAEILYGAETRHDRYLYYQYLEFGPSYPDPLCKLLRCSETRRKVTDYCKLQYSFVKKALWEN